MSNNHFADLLLQESFRDGYLTKAVKQNNRTLVRSLLQMGADPDEPNAKGETPIYEAIRIGNLEIVKLLIEWDANLDVVNDNHFSPVETAIANNKADILKFLLRHGEVKAKNVKLAAELKQSGIKETLSNGFKKRVFKVRSGAII